MDEMEREMIQRMQRGDNEAFSWLFRKYQNRILRMAYLISGNYADSEDIVQETFVKCYTYRKHLKDPEKFEAWLCQIMTRTAWRMLKKNRREQPAEAVRDEYEPDQSGTPLETVLRREEKGRLWEAVKHLEIRQRTVIVLYYYSQMSTKEIANAMGCLEGTVKSRLHTARKRLKGQLDAEEKEGFYEKRTV